MSNSVETISAETLSPFVERAPRNATDWVGLVRTSDGIEMQCKIKNISKTGAKIGISEAYDLPQTFMLKFGKGFVCRVRLVWRKGNFAGLKVEQITQLASAATSG